MSDFDDGPFSMDIDREPMFLASDGWGDWYERNDRIDYAPGEIWQTHVPWDKTRRFDMPTYEDFGPMTLYRGTSIKVSPSEFESLWDGVIGGMPSRISTIGPEILSRHLSGGLGKSWSTDINVAYDFSSVTNDNDHLVGVVIQADWEGGSHDKQRNLSDWNFMVHQESEIQLDYGTQVSVTHIGFRMDGMSNSDVVMVPVPPRQFTTSIQGSIDDIMDLLGPSVPSYSGPGLEEISRPLPPAVQDTTGDADVWLPTSVAAHYKEYDRSGPAVDELEALIARDGLLTPIRISTDGREAVVNEGNHRLQVAQRLGISEVPAIVTFDDPVVSNGGRVTPLEPVLGSWVEQNRGRLRSFWGHRTASDYFMQHRPAGPDYGGPMHDVSDFFPDIEALPTRMYDFGEPGSQGSIRQIIDAQGNPNKPVTIYRAVPKGADPIIRNGDWVTISREYAEQHGMSNVGGVYDILSATVQAKDIWTEGNSVNEFGYWGPELRTARTYTASPFPYHDTYTQPFLPGHDWPIYLYRGMGLRLPPSLESELDIAIMEADQSMIQQAGGKVLDMIGNIGRHWTTEPDVAMDFAESNRYAANLIVVISAVWERKGEDFAEEHVGWDGVTRPSNLADEFEVTLTPGTQVRLLSVKARRVLNGQTIERDWEIELLGSPQIRTAGTRTDPGGVYRGINVQVLSHDEQQQLAEWANANAFSLYDYQLAEPNYELVYRILDRLDSGGLGRHWSKDYDVSASFARDQGDGIELILIGHWEGEGVDQREFHRGWDGVQRPSNLPHEEEVTLYPGTPVTLVGMDIVTETGFTYNIPVPNIQVTAEHDMKHLANRTAAAEKLYRGLRIIPDPSTADRIQAAADAKDYLTVGNEIMDIVDRDTGAGTSWTKSEGVAIRFALANDSWIPPGTFAVVLEGEWSGGSIDHSRDRDDDDADRYEQYEDEVRLHAGDRVDVTMISFRASSQAHDMESYMESMKWTTWPVYRTLTAAEPGGVLPWNPSHRGYTWVTHSDGTLEAVTNDGVNRMYLHEYPHGWEWEVFDSLGFVEGGTFGMALKGGDALRQRANELLAEFDTRAEMRTRGPSRGYQDDYTPAPNTLWSKRATTSQRYAERLRREGRR